MCVKMADGCCWSRHIRHNQSRVCLCFTHQCILKPATKLVGTKEWSRGWREGWCLLTWGADGGLRGRSAGWTSEPRQSLFCFFSFFNLTDHHWHKWDIVRQNTHTHTHTPHECQKLKVSSWKDTGKQAFMFSLKYHHTFCKGNILWFNSDTREPRYCLSLYVSPPCKNRHTHIQTNAFKTTMADLAECNVLLLYQTLNTHHYTLLQALRSCSSPCCAKLYKKKKKRQSAQCKNFIACCGWTERLQTSGGVEIRRAEERWCLALNVLSQRSAQLWWNPGTITHAHKDVHTYTDTHTRCVLVNCSTHLLKNTGIWITPWP